MDGKDRGFFVADLGVDLSFQSAQIRTGFVSSRFVICQFGGDFGVFEALRVRIHENLVNHVSRTNRDSR